MESPPDGNRAWYFFDNRVPPGEVIVPIKNSRGLAFAVRPTATAEEIVGALNATAEFVLGVGLARVGQTEQQKPPDLARKE